MLNNLSKIKYIFLGDTESINIEIIVKSHNFLKNRIRYVVICSKSELYFYLTRINSKLKVNEIFDPIKLSNYKINQLNIFNIENKYKEKYKNLLNQLDISNNLSKLTGHDLVTMPIDKSIFKKKIKFNGLTEYLGKINACKTAMLMHGEKFSIIPLTTHINLKEVHRYLENNKLKIYLKNIMDLLCRSKYKLNFKNIIFLCYNPHCSEDNTIGKEDDLISKIIRKSFKKILGPYPADSAFNNIKKNTLFISTYHDQSLIPFKIINKKGINYTLGLNYRRFSPAHGTAKDILFKNKAKNDSYIQCMLI